MQSKYEITEVTIFYGRPRLRYIENSILCFHDMKIMSRRNGGDYKTTSPLTAVTEQLICVFIFVYAKTGFPRRGRLQVGCVPMREKKTMRKGPFFRAGQCAALSSFRVGKCYFCRKRVCVLQILQKVAE